MDTLESMFSRYAQSHRHRTNVRIHTVAVPALLFCVLGLLWPARVAGVPLACVAALGFFLLALRLDRPLAGLLALELAAFQLALWQLYARLPTSVALMGVAGLFVAAWALQFVGHHLEGKRPSFFDDLRFLLVGPLWTLQRLRTPDGK